MATINSIVLPGGWTRIEARPTFNTTVYQDPNGMDITVPNWLYGLWFITASYKRAVVTGSLDLVYATFLGSQGGAYGFLVLDPIDCTDSALGGFGVVVQVGGVYRLAKLYTNNTLNYYRLIRRPFTSGAGAVVLSGVAGAGLSLDPTTGIIANATSTGTWSGSFWIPMRFLDDGLAITSGPDGIVDVTVKLKEDGSDS